jgi:hypothetical protein
LLSLLASILLPWPTDAAVLVYKGTTKTSYIGEGQTLKPAFKLYLLVDSETADVVRLEYATIDGIKGYSTGSSSNQHIVQFTLTQGKSYSAIARIPNDCQAAEDPGSEGVYLHGADAPLTIGTGVPFTFPKVLSGSGSALFYSDSSGQPVLWSGTLTASFNQTETIRANDAGETLDATLSRLRMNLEMLGYLSMNQNRGSIQSRSAVRKF